MCMDEMNDINDKSLGLPGAQKKGGRAGPLVKQREIFFKRSTERRNGEH